MGTMRKRSSRAFDIKKHYSFSQLNVTQLVVALHKTDIVRIVESFFLSISQTTFRKLCSPINIVLRTLLKESSNLLLI